MKGELFVVGIGPGTYEDMTLRSVRILEECEVIVGYSVYIELLATHFKGKPMITTPMKQEVKRCELAWEEVRKGKKVAMVCSGDAGVYGMAGLLLELQQSGDPKLTVVPGVTAALSGGALLGAPLTHDFAVISLSDLLTPWEAIEKRLLYAAKADLAICLYNPSSKKRHDYLQKACDILLKEKEPHTVCGISVNIGREGESTSICTLEKLREKKVDMFTTVFVGNQSTKVLNGRMVTPRGYRHG